MGLARGHENCLLDNGHVSEYKGISEPGDGVNRCAVPQVSAVAVSLTWVCGSVGMCLSV